MFADTSAWYAAADRSEPEHERVARFLLEGTLPLVTTNYVFDECVTLVLYRLGHAAACRFGEGLRGSRRTTMVAVTGADEEEAWRLFRREGNRRWSFTDCTSFAVMRRLKIETALAVDDGFRGAGFQLVP